MNQIDILTQDSFSENLANIFLFTISGITLFYWIFAFRKTIFSPQDCLKYFPLFVCIRSFYSGGKDFLAGQRWKNIKTAKQVKQLIDSRKGKGLYQNEWSILTIDQRFFSLFVERDSDTIEVTDLENGEEIKLEFSNISEHEQFNIFLRDGLCSSIKLTELFLDTPALSDECFSFILESNLFSRLKLLKSLNISKMSLSSISAQNLFSALLETGTQIEKLELGATFSPEENFDILYEYLEQNSELKTFIFVGDYDFKPESISPLLDSICTENLGFLSLQTYGLNDTNFSSMIDLVRKAKVLYHLDFDNKQVSIEKMIPFYDMLSEIEILDKLEVVLVFPFDRSFDFPKDFGFNEAANTISKNKNIKILESDFFSGIISSGYIVKDFLDKRRCFLQSEEEILDFSEFVYEAAQKGLNGAVTLALSLLTLEEKEELKKNIFSEVNEVGQLSMKELIHRHGQNRKEETLDALFDIFGDEVYVWEEPDVQHQEEEDMKEFSFSDIEVATPVTVSAVPSMEYSELVSSKGSRARKCVVQ
eukprot:snap_masked-scaffold_8-processed-gene-14.30-mRNA-1 protein AED:1.00 eAED:1.00 QI:0/0/0/0/1/1/2/0/533